MRIVQTVIAQKFDGLATPIPDADALRGPLTNLHSAGIDLVVMNGGGAAAADVGALTFVGQTKSVAGHVAGEAAKKMDQPKKVICVNHYIMVAESTQRCNGFKDGSGAKVVEIDATQDPNSVAQRVQAALSANPDADSVLTLGPVGAIPTIDVLKKLGLNGKLHFYTFDLNPEILDGLSDGRSASPSTSSRSCRATSPSSSSTLITSSASRRSVRSTRARRSLPRPTSTSLSRALPQASAKSSGRPGKCS